MKKIVVLLLISWYTFNCFGQNETGIPNYTNINFYPMVEVSKVDANYTMLVGGASSITFSERVVVGLYGFKNMTDTKSSLSQFSTLKVKYEQVGVWLGGKVQLGAYKNKGEYAKRKMRFTYSFQMGGGRIYLADENIKGTKDYYFAFRPMIGLERPIFKKVALGFNVGYQLCSRIAKYDYSNKDFSSPFANLYVKVSIFDKKTGLIYKNH